MCCNRFVICETSDRMDSHKIRSELDMVNVKSRYLVLGASWCFWYPRYLWEQTQPLSPLSPHVVIALLPSPPPTSPTAAAQHPYHIIGSLLYHCNNGRLIPPLIPRRGRIIRRYYDDNNNAHIIVRRIPPLLIQLNWVHCNAYVDELADQMLLVMCKLDTTYK